jgi:hypothetical protein
MMMKVPTQYDLTHLQLQAMLREHNIPETELKYIGERVYPENFKGHPEYHGQMMHWYLIANEHEVPVCDIGSVDCMDD